ncbi:MAG: mechanosensitive ion channel [Neisseria sp.]|nr:mechanosensitive ion channel [Neisseria sp.]
MNNLFSADGILAFFAQLLAPSEFTSALLERSFKQTSGWIELVISLVILFATLAIASFWNQKHPISESTRFPFLRHVGQRILWPVLMLISAMLAATLWEFFDLSNKALWLRLLVLAAHWMMIIRLVLAVIHAALPTNAFTIWLEKTLSYVFWLAFLVRLSGIDDIIIDGMKNLSFTIGSSELNLWTISTGLLWIALILVLAMWLAKFIKRKLMGNQHIDMNLRIMLSNIVQIVLIVLSVLIALPLVGIDLTVLSVFGGALGVGIGFGLQKIASNYISGFMILGDRSIRPGDRLTVNNFTGYVTKITSRFVVLRSASGTEALIPNETFITNTVINESYTGNSLLQGLDIQISYQSDVEKAMAIMVEAAKKHSRIESTPEPKAFLISFGDNGINLRLSFWLKDPENGFLGLFSTILLEIWQRFSADGIELPYPQREIRILPSENPSESSGQIQNILNNQTNNLKNEQQ